MKRTLFLITGLGQGGAEKFLVNVLPYLDASKICVVSITGVNDRGAELEQKGIRVQYLNNTKKFHPITTPYKFFKIVRAFKPQIIFTLLIHADIFGRILGRLMGIHTIYCSIRNDYSQISKLWIIDKYTQFLVSTYIPNSYGLHSYMEKIGTSNYSVLVNGVDLESLEATSTKNSIREELHISKSDFVVCCNARLEKQKNHFALLEAFCGIDGQLILLNDGSYRNAISQKINELGLSLRVHLLGKRDDVISILSECDAFVLASFTEGMSNALLEAMAMRLPCIVSDIEQNSVIIKDASMRFSTPSQLHSALLMIQKNPTHSNSIGEKNRKTIERNYDIKVVAKQLRKLLR